MHTLDNIRIRDPFILPVPAEHRYYLYGTTDASPWHGRGESFLAWSSLDLENWEGPFTVFTPPDDFWADQNFWAPEVYMYQDAYIMIASFKHDNKCRGVQILSGDSPLGPFRPLTNAPITPDNWDCLDGTLYIEHGVPWLIFSHEWTQIVNGEICAVPLTSNLTACAGKIRTLFRATDAPWTAQNTGDVHEGKNGWVTDGPFLYRDRDEQLCMLWSSFTSTSYAIGTAVSDNGMITGSWQQNPSPVFEKDGGHGMLFQTFEGGTYLAMHRPNHTPDERVYLIEWD